MKCRGRRPCGPAPNSIVYAFFFVTFFSLTGINCNIAMSKLLNGKLEVLARAANVLIIFLMKKMHFRLLYTVLWD